MRGDSLFPRPAYRDLYPTGVPQSGDYRLLLSTDDGEFGGFGTQQPDLSARAEGWNSQTHHLRLNLPPNSLLEHWSKRGHLCDRASD